ncbi:ATP-binding protein [Lacibacter sp. H375]|uniref:sensor histidine kinase n=1 Tax=Lacibacter sp. H375 TaxID=3133424 RepID=UPI0030C631A7
MDSEIAQLLFYFTIAILLLGIFLIVFVIIYRLRMNNYLKEKEQTRLLYEQTLLQTQLEIQEQTLKNISQEIHDNVGQVLTLAKLNLATTAVDDSGAREKIKTSQQLIGKAIQDLRDLSRSLNTDYVEQMGLLRSIEYELELLKKTGSIQTSFLITGTVEKLDKHKELILFRIVQEAIHNVIRHAEAGKINTTVVFSNHAMEICIEDNGKGFDIKPITNSGGKSFGLGIRNMHERATLIGTRFSINSEPGSGTKLYLQVPLNETMDEAGRKN